MAMESARSFDSKILAKSIQKKFLQKMATKKITRQILLDDSSSRSLNMLHQVAKIFSDSRKIADKIIKDLLKLTVKIGLLLRNEIFTQSELDCLEIFKRRFSSLLVTITSFHEVEYSYDYKFLEELMSLCKKPLVEICEPHLTAKSLKRIDNVFGFFTNKQFMDALFNVEISTRSKEMSKCLELVIHDLRSLVDEAR